MGGGGSSLDKLLKAWGIQFDTGKVVADMKYKMQLRGRARRAAGSAGVAGADRGGHQQG